MSAGISWHSWAGSSLGLQWECAVLSETCSRTLLPSASFGPWLQVMGWSLQLFGQGRIFKRLTFIARVPKVSWAQVLSQSRMLCTYSWSLRQRLFGKGHNCLRINSRNLQLISTSVSPHTLSYKFVPAWRAVTCIGHACQSEKCTWVFVFQVGKETSGQK